MSLPRCSSCRWAPNFHANLITGLPLFVLLWQNGFYDSLELDIGTWGELKWRETLVISQSEYSFTLMWLAKLLGVPLKCNHFRAWFSAISPLMVVKGVLNTVAQLLKVALGEKEKSFARKRSNLTGEFWERVTEVPAALARQCLCSGQLWAWKAPSRPEGSKAPCRAQLVPTLHTPRKPESQNGRTPPLYKSAASPLSVFHWIDKKVTQKVEENSFYFS